MSQAVSRIKSRIKSVSGAYKVTSAMKLVSNVKLKTWKYKMLANKEYNQELSEVVENILSYAKKASSPFYKQNKANKKLYVVVSSSLGLCGSYNANIFKVADSAISKEDDAIILGNKGAAHYIDGQFKKLEGYETYNGSENTLLVDKIASYILKEYEKETYSEVHLIYSEYKNSLLFLAKDYKLLPIEPVKDSNIGYGPLLEPSEKELIDSLVPIYIKNIVYSKLLESSVCEEASRSNAMENATNNAKEILDDLKIEFNKARQGAITQEIIEIVSASKAL